MKQKRLEKGITLIALVIIIVVLVILLGVTINIAIRNRQIEKLENVVDKLNELEKKMEQISEKIDNTEGVHKTINGATPAYNNPIIPVGFKISNEGASWASTDGKTVEGWNDGLVIEDEEGNQFVWVPAQIVGTGETAIEGVAEYKKWCTTGIEYYKDEISDDSLPSGVISEEYEIAKYGGFYIARYEAGIPESMIDAISPIAEGEEEIYDKVEEKRNVSGTEIRPVSKKNQVPWSHIDYDKAKANAENMYTGSKVKSGLLTGTSWDTVMKWLEISGVNVQYDSTSWGNYENAEVTGVTQYSVVDGLAGGVFWESTNSVTKSKRDLTLVEAGDIYWWLLKTGNSEYTKRKNIYDLAGNVREWTYEIYYNDRVSRGGSYFDTGDYRPASNRWNLNTGYDERHTGFRVRLYLK